MKVPFDSIKEKREFKLEKEGVVFSGVFYKEGEVVKVDSNLEGQLNVICDRCGDEFLMDVNEEIKLDIVKGISEDKENFDIIEVFKNEVDFNEIFEGEIEGIKLDFKYCKKCRGE